MRIRNLTSFAFAGALLVVGAARLQPTTTSLKLIEHDVNTVYTDTGDKDDSGGDILSFSNPVFDDKDEKQVGTANGFCIRTAVGEAYECVVTLIQPDGQLTSYGPFYDAKDSTGGLVGETGVYAGAHGLIGHHYRTGTPNELDWNLEISQ